MKVIKQKDQKYSSYQMRLETVIDRIIYSKGTRRRYMKKFNNKRYERRFYTLAHMFGNKYGRIDGLNFLACGVSHLDAAWLFPVVDTKMRAFKTFYMAVEHCEEFPFFTFSQTTPQYYDWIRVYWPELWEKVREKVKQGRIELTGGMWVEPDLDMPCGESLVRQRLYGQLFFLKYFGFYPTMESLLDVFGFPWSLPQILVKSGATSFWTTKDSGGLPMNTCYWQGIDGTQIFMHQFTYNWDSMTSLNSFKRKARFPKKEFERTELNSHLTGAEIQSRFSENPAHMNPNFPFFYGLGDGGRGPLEFEIMWADAFVKNYSGRHVSQHEIMEIMKESMGDQYFIWNDEKYLGYHRGTKTTQNLVKHLNRRAECWALAAETIQTLTALISPDTASIDKTIVFDMWQKILFNQFHDILPGSSIPDVYVLTKKELEAAIKIARGMIHDSLAQFQIGSDEILIFNPYNWERSEYLEISGKLYYVNSVPGLAMQKYKLTALACGSDTVPKFQEEVYNHGPSSKDLACYSIENEYIKALFDRKTGEILSIAHNATQSEVIQLDYGKLHSPTTPSSKLWRSGLRVFWENPTRWKAWNLDVRYPLNIIPIDSNDPPEILTNSNGVEELRTTFRFRKSMVTVKFSLREKDKWLKWKSIRISGTLKFW